MFKDKKFGLTFPTRHGGAAGTGTERQMLDRLGGANSFRTSYQTNPDGSVIRCDTKNGMPQFTLSSAPSAAAQAGQSLYMETGQLEWTFPGPENPTRAEPAKWHFLNISPTSDYLGNVAVAAHGAQTNTTALAEGQNSLAIGTTEAKQLDYTAITVLKKTVAGLFPPSLFSGKMRLFMQAQYGAKETASSAFTIDVLGESILLYYQNSSGERLQLGFWVHNSPGIFTASDGSFWLLVFGQVGGNYVVTAYAIKHSAEARTLQDLYRAGAYVDATEKTKMEAYLFAYSTIDISNPQVVGSFTAPAGGTMAYGWKWKTDGSQAGVVVHELLGTGAANYRWKARTVLVSFTYADGAFSLAASTTTHGEWTDGWGVFNMFVPTSESSGASLMHYSLATNLAGVKPAFTFSNTPVYGYYKGDVWTEVTINRTVRDTLITSQEHTGLSFNAGQNMNEASVYQYGYHPADTGFFYRYKEETNSTVMNISFGGFSFAGSASYGSKYDHTLATSAVGSPKPVFINFVAAQIGSGVGYDNQESAAGYTSVTAWTAGEKNSLWVGTSQGTYTYQTHGYTYKDFQAWSLVIPSCDAEAAYIATVNRSDNSNGFHETKVVGLVTMHIDAYKNTGFTTAITPWVPADSFGWYDDAYTITTTSDSAVPPNTPEVHVYAFNQAIHGTEGVPGGSYETLFTVDRTYPYYNRGMYAYTSYNGRYAMSEGLVSPASVNYQYRFVGWA